MPLARIALPRLIKGLLLSIPVLINSQNQVKAADPPVPNQYGAIYENDGVPDELGAGKKGWTYTVQNTTYGNITSIKFSEIFSLSTPVLVLRPNSSWSLVATDTNSDKLWEIIISTTNPLRYIQPNSMADFGFSTDYNTNSLIKVGNRDGALKFDGDGHWYIPNIEQLVGPTGAYVQINATAGSNGSITPSGLVNVDYGASTNFNITANQPGYRLSSILTNGVTAWTNSSGNNNITSTNWAWANATNHASITANFEPKTFTLTVVSAHGTPVPGTTNNVPYGTTVNQSIETIVTNQVNPEIRHKVIGYNIQ